MSAQSESDNAIGLDDLDIMFTDLSVCQPVKAPCTYGLKCRGRNGGCPFSHPAKPEKTLCFYGLKCRGRNGGCTFAHPAKPVKSEITCRWGISCHGFKSGKCPFKHDNA